MGRGGLSVADRYVDDDCVHCDLLALLTGEDSIRG
jgi:hypothetical protein